MNRKHMTITPGLMLMIMIFIILCMISFASLYYIEASRANDGVNKSYDAIKEYYEADSQMMTLIDNYKQDIKKGKKIYHNGDIINLEIEVNNHQKIVVELVFFDNDLEVSKYQKVVKNEMGY